MTPAATETKRPIAHRCCHNHDSGIVAPPSDRKTPSAVLSFTAETNFSNTRLRNPLFPAIYARRRLQKLSSGNRVSRSYQMCAALFRCALSECALAIWSLTSLQVGKGEGEHLVVTSDDGEP